MGLKELMKLFGRLRWLSLEFHRTLLELVQLDWSTHLHHALECYNMTVEGEDEDPRNINILEAKGHHEVKGPQIGNLDIIVLL